MTNIPFRRDHIYVNLIRFLFSNNDESRIQNFYPPGEDFSYKFRGKDWFYFPFEIKGLSSSLDFDSLSSDLKMPNIEDLNNVWNNKLTRSNFSEKMEGAEVEIFYLFLNPDEEDENNSNVFKPYDPPVFLSSIFNVNFLSYSPGVITLKLQNPLNAVDQTIPNRHFAGKSYRELPLDNSPRFTSGISYD